MRPVLLSIASFAIIHSSAQTPTITWGAEQNVNSSGTGYFRPRVVVNADQEPVVLWGKTSMNANYVAVGSTGTFSAPIMIHPMMVHPAVADWQGTELAASGDTIWAVMKATPEMDMPMFMVRSTDGGTTWGDTVRIDVGHGAMCRFPEVAVGPTGEPIVEYMAFESGFLDPHHVVTRSTGGVFGAPVNVSTPFAPGEVCDCCPGAITTAGDQAVAFYRNNGSNVRTIWAASSDDAGATFPVGAEVDPTDWVINACPSSGPDAYLAGDSVRFVWMSSASGAAKAYIGSANSPDLITGIGQRLTSSVVGAVENYPRIAGNGDTLGVVWQRTTGGNSDVLFCWSVTGIMGLSIPDTVHADPTGQQRTPDIAFANGTFHIVWTDLSGTQVRYRAAAITNAIGIPENSNAAIRAWPVPATDQLHIEANRSVEKFQLLDAAGHIAMEFPGDKHEVQVGHLAPGTYRLIGLNRGGSEVTSSAVVIAGR